MRLTWLLQIPFSSVAFILYLGSWNPALLICASGFIFHPSWAWFSAFIIAVAFHYSIKIIVDSAVSLKSLEGAKGDVLNAQSGFCLEEVDDTAFFNRDDFPHYFLPREWLRKTVGQERFSAAQDGDPWLFRIHPLRVFVARKTGGGLIGGAKAYVNHRGPSLIFLSKIPKLLNANQRFILMHELEHVSVRGAHQLSHIYSCRVWGPIGVLLLCFLAVSWFHWLGLAFYILELLLKCSFVMPILREVIADNGALHKASDTKEQIDVAQDLITMFRDHVASGSPFTIAAQRRRFIRNGQLFWRIKYLERFAKQLKKGKGAPVLHFYQTTSQPYLVLFGLLFIHLGMITEQPPMLPLHLMAYLVGTAIAWEFLWYRRKTDELNAYVDDYLAQHVASLPCSQKLRPPQSPCAGIKTHSTLPGSTNGCS